MASTSSVVAATAPSGKLLRKGWGPPTRVVVAVSSRGRPVACRASASPPRSSFLTSESLAASLRWSGRRRSAGALRTCASAESSPEPLPSDPVEMVKQAAAAVKRGAEAGKMRHRLDLLLPINEKEFDFGERRAAECIQKEYDTAVNLIKLLAEQVLGAGAKLSVKRIDDGGVEGEPCGVITDAGKRFAAVVYPTSDKLKQIRALAEQEGRMLLIVNPQWRESGQIVSDFGFGPWKKKAYEFLDTFENSYLLLERRVGAPGSVSAATGARFTTGGVLRTLRCYPGKFEVFAMAVDGSNQLLGMFDDMLTYKESEDIIQQGRDAKLEIFTRAVQVSKLQDEGKAAAEGLPVAQVLAEDPSQPLTETIIEAMDAVQIKRALSARGIPTSGKLAVLRKRLKEAAVEAA
eukprot:jgi/Tetstr1/428603/TSEL_018594.t1